MADKNPRILITNDDGIDAPGISALYKEIAPIGRVTVVAPDGQQSAVGHAVSFKEVHLRRVYRDGILWGYALGGTPADCVKFGVTKLMKRHPPALVISGINHGQNVGNSILYSGTIAAAMEAAMFRIPSIAVSISFRRDRKTLFEYAARFIRDLALKVLKHGLPQDVFLNVNVPNVPAEDVKGAVVTRQGKSMFVDLYQEVRREGDKTILQNIGEEMILSNGGEDLDDVVLFQNKVSITPLHYDLTYKPFRKKLAQWIENLGDVK